MPTIVVPFRGFDAKRRLDEAPGDLRVSLARAMLEDVVAAAVAVGTTVVTTRSAPPPVVVAVEELGAEHRAAPGLGLGDAVAHTLRTAPPGPVLVVNADLPAATPRDLLTLLGHLPAGGIALVAAADGTTNALALASPALFAPVYGPGSAARFRAHAAAQGGDAVDVDLDTLAADVDTLADLEALDGRLGRRTQACLDALRAPVHA